MDTFWVHSLILTFVSVPSPIYFPFSPPFQISFIHPILTSPQIPFSHIPIPLTLWSPSYCRTNSNTQLHSHFRCFSCMLSSTRMWTWGGQSVGFIPFGYFPEFAGWVHSFHERAPQKRYRESLWKVKLRQWFGQISLQEGSSVNGLWVGPIAG